MADESYRAGHRDQATRRRLLLDTNVWAQLCDFEGREKVRALYKAARSKGVRIVVVPPVAYEVMARPREYASAQGLRDRAWVLSRAWWAREPSDAYLEAGEVYFAVAKHRPQWLRRRRQDMLDALANDWTMSQQSLPLSLARELFQGEVSDVVMATRVGDRVRVPGFWTRLRDSPESFAALMRRRQAELDQARSNLKATKLAEAIAVPSLPPTTKVRGREVDAWRAWAALTMPSMLLADL